MGIDVRDKRDAFSLLSVLLAAGLLAAAGCGPGEKEDNPGVVEPDTGGGGDVDEWQLETGVDAGADVAPDGTSSKEVCDADLETAAIAPVDSTSSGKVDSTPESTGYTTTVEAAWGSATESKPYVYLRLLKGTQVPLTDNEALADAHWDMGIRGTTIRLNGGVSGPGGVEGAAVDKSFENVEKSDAPSTLTTDQMTKSCAPKPEARSALQTAFGQWWTSGTSPENPTPADKTYVIRNLDGELIKLAIEKIEPSGQKATYTLRWAKLDQGPSCDVEQARRDAIQPIDQVSNGAVSEMNNVLSIDASAGGIGNSGSRPYVYIDLDDGTKASITDKQAFDDDKWDLGLERVVLRVNGGDSGTGGVKVARKSAASLGEVTMVPASGSFAADDFVDDFNCDIRTGPIGNPQTAIGNSWYTYEMSNGQHKVVPTDNVYVIETTDGNHVKIKINSYSDGQFEIAYEKM